MKKLLILVCSLTLVFALDVKIGGNLQNINKKIDKKILCVHKLKITSLKVTTDNYGNFAWQAVVKNLGPGQVCDNKHVTLQGYQYANGKKFPASGIMLSKKLKKNETVKQSLAFEKKCGAKKLELDIFEKSSLVTKKIVNFPNLKHKLTITKVDFDKKNNTWKAYIRNSFSKLKITVQGEALVNGTWKPSGGTTVLAVGTTSTPVILYYPSNATKLKVVVYISCSPVNNGYPNEKITEKTFNIPK